MDKPKVVSIIMEHGKFDAAKYRIELPYGLGTHVVDSKLYEYITSSQRNSGSHNTDYRNERQQFRESVMTAFEAARNVRMSPFQRPLDFVMQERVKLFYAPRQTGKTTILKDIRNDLHHKSIDEGRSGRPDILVIAPHTLTRKDFEIETNSENTTTIFTTSLDGLLMDRLRGRGVKFSTILIDEFAFGRFRTKDDIKNMLSALMSHNHISDDIVVLGLTTPK